jgi:xanthine dehydrogenase large subunit
LGYRGNSLDCIPRPERYEPPLLLPFSVFFAIRDAIASVADYRVNPPLNAPATPEAILNAVMALQTSPAPESAAAGVTA